LFLIEIATTLHAQTRKINTNHVPNQFSLLNSILYQPSSAQINLQLLQAWTLWTLCYYGPWLPYYAFSLAKTCVNTDLDQLLEQDIYARQHKHPLQNSIKNFFYHITKLPHNIYQMLQTTPMRSPL